MDSTKMVFNLDQIDKTCRFCLEQNNELLSVFSQFRENDFEINISIMLSNCTNIKISETNDFPQQICKNCIQKLNIAYNFKKQAEDIDIILRKLIATKESSQKDEEEDGKQKIEFMEIIENKYDEIDSDLDNDELLNEKKEIKIENSVTIKDELMIGELEPLTCAECFTEFSNKNLKDEHRCIKNDKFICRHCNRKFRSEKFLEAHLEKIHSLKYILSNDDIKFPHRCEQCENVFPCLDSIRIHIKSQHPKIKCSCIICFKIFTDKFKLDKHLINKHEVRTDTNVLKPFNCDICEKAYTTFANLNAHKADHVGFRPYLCEICNRGFTKRSSLLSHLAVHSGLKSHLCSECGRSFTSSNILLQHKKTHSRTRSHICNNCNKGFHTSNDLRIHYRTHSGEKPYLCSTCGRGFARVTHLNIHLRTHSGEKPYSCKICQKSFAQSGDLKSHIRIHTGEKPYCCKICNKRFNQSSGLSSHMKSHLGEKNYLCEICNKGFTQSSSLTRHLKIHDGNSLKNK